MAKGCTTLQAEKILSAALTAKRQPSRRLVLNSSCFIRDLYRDSSPAAQNDSVRREDSARNVGSFLRKELPNRAEDRSENKQGTDTPYPPSPDGVHSEHDLKERKRRANHSESFPL